MAEKETQVVAGSSVPYNTAVAALEKWADETFNTKNPVKLPEGARRWLADNAWWLVLIGGILTLWSAWSFWNVGQDVNQWSNYANELARTYGTPTTADGLGVTWYLALGAMLVQAVLYLLAFQQLKVHKKSGWNLLFYASLVSLVMGVAYVFTSGYGVGSLIGTLIGVAIGWTILFQVRSKFAQ